jgi:hypothetical protein
MLYNKQPWKQLTTLYIKQCAVLKVLWNVAAGRQVNSHRLSKGEFPPPSFRPWICRNHVLPKHWQLFTGPRGVASQETGIFISTTVRTSYFALCVLIFTIGTDMRSCRKYSPKWPNNNSHEVDICDYWMIISTGTENWTSVVIIIINIIRNVVVNINRQQ